MNFMAMVVFWAALGAVTLGLAVYRKTLASHEDRRHEQDRGEAEESVLELGVEHGQTG